VTPALRAFYAALVDAVRAGEALRRAPRGTPAYERAQAIEEAAVAAAQRARLRLSDAEVERATEAINGLG
jgi:hypothetical protein